jgi:DNA-binding MarR family transcriptional regulator
MDEGVISAEAASLARDYAAVYRHCHPAYSMNLGHQAVRALQLVAEAPMTVGDLAAALAVAPNTASELVRRLVQRGLVEKQRSTTDERSVTLSITMPGRHVLDENTLLDRAKLSRCLAGMPAAERRLVAAGMELLAAKLGAGGETR